MEMALEILGTVAFAISGVNVAVSKKMDVLGVVVLGLVTAVGGGIIRDIILGITPPTAFREPVYMMVAIGVSIICFIPPIRRWINRREMILRVIDAIGLGVFTVVGVRASIPFTSGFLSIFVGTLTGVGGGVLRDVFATNKPYIFVKHFYACASLLGAIACTYLWRVMDGIWAMVIGAVLTIVLRLLAAKFRWSLPKAHGDDETEEG